MSPWMQVLPAKRREENCTERYLRGLRNQRGEHLLTLCKSNILETQVIVKPISQRIISC